MDDLMTEATDLFLSNNKAFVKDLNNVFKWERRKSAQDLNDASSITLLRSSIAKSLKERSQSEVIDSLTPKRRKSRRRRGSYSGRPTVDVQFLDREIAALGRNENNQDISAKEQNKLDVPDNVLTKLFTENYGQAETAQPQSETKQVKANGDVNANVVEESAHHNPAEVGLRLAQRQFSDNIFENCSTYSLACSEALPDRKYSSSSKANFGVACNFSGDKRSKTDIDILHRDDNKKSEEIDKDNSADDQIYLTDTFLANVNNGDDSISQKSFYSKDIGCLPISRKSSTFSTANSDGVKLDSEKLQFRSERKLSKKERKRQKRSKTNNDVPTYDCPKCGVSYILSNSTSSTTARCLHCDLWKSVEPVFLKREKQPWNTCQIC